MKYKIELFHDKGPYTDFLPSLFFRSTPGNMNKSWYEAWLVKPNAPGSWELSNVGDNLKKLYKNDGITIPNEAFNDYFYMPAAGRDLESQDLTDLQRTKTRGWISITARAAYYYGMKEADLDGPKVFKRDNKATGAGHLYSCANDGGNDVALRKKGELFGVEGRTCPEKMDSGDVLTRNLFVWWNWNAKDAGETHVSILPFGLLFPF